MEASSMTRGFPTRGSPLTNRRELQQDALKRSPVQPEAPSGFGYVAAAIAQDSADVFPFDALERWSLEGDGADLAYRRGVSGERGMDLVGVGRFLEVMACAETHGVERGCDAAVAGEHDDSDPGIERFQVAD